MATLIVNVSRLVDGRLQALGVVKADRDHIQFDEETVPYLLRAIPTFLPFLYPLRTYEQLASLPPVVPMPNGTPLLIKKQWQT